jgi:hypothetical protein
MSTWQADLIYVDLVLIFLHDAFVVSTRTSYSGLPNSVGVLEA